MNSSDLCEETKINEMIYNSHKFSRLLLISITNQTVFLNKDIFVVKAIVLYVSL